MVSVKAEQAVSLYFDVGFPTTSFAQLVNITVYYVKVLLTLCVV